MSSGRFVRSKYGADYGTGSAIHPIRVQPETLLATTGVETNDPPAGDINNPISAKISLGMRARGLSPRFITLEFPSTPPANYTAFGITRIPALNAAFYGAVTVGGVVEYLGVNCICVSKTPEFAD